jgi:hypothetical protein
MLLKRSTQENMLELIVAQGASTETAHIITKQENDLLAH